MAKVDVDTVTAILQENQLPPDLVRTILRQINEEIRKEQEDAAKTREPRAKNQFVILLSDPRGILPEEDFVGWVLQLPEDHSPGVALERVAKAADLHNTSPKGRKHPVKTLGEACEVVSPKFQKENLVSIKTRLPVTVLRTDNSLPSVGPGRALRREDLRGEDVDF